MQYYSAVCIVSTHQQQNLVFRQFVETFDPQLYPTVHCSQLHMTNNDLYPIAQCVVQWVTYLHSSWPNCLDE